MVVKMEKYLAESSCHPLLSFVHLKAKLDDLLGEHWHVRGLSRAGDFCYAEPGTVRFYFKSPWQKSDNQFAEDGTMKTQYFGFCVPVCQK